MFLSSTFLIGDKFNPDAGKHENMSQVDVVMSSILIPVFYLTLYHVSVFGYDDLVCQWGDKHAI